MHQQSHDLMAQFAMTLAPHVSVLDIGSLDINGTYRDLFVNQDYIGMDMEEGKNVDILQKEPYKFPFYDENFDVVVSGNVMEHVKFLWEWVLEVDRVLKHGGSVCMVTPYKIHYHPYPVDCWRVMTDGMVALFQDWMLEKRGYKYDIIRNELSEMDTILIALKP